MLLDTVNVCVVCVRNYTVASSFFPFFYHFQFRKPPDFRAISKSMVDIFLQILGENWLDDTGKAGVPVQPKVYCGTIFI